MAGEQVAIWLWDTHDEQWHRAPYSVLTVRLVGIGQVIAGAHELYWVMCNPSAVATSWDLSDAVAPAGAIVVDHFDASRESHMVTFNPPMHFHTGIYLEAVANITSITFGYI